jgi:hypothetical protein
VWAGKGRFISNLRPLKQVGLGLAASYVSMSLEAEAPRRFFFLPTLYRICTTGSYRESDQPVGSSSIPVEFEGEDRARRRRPTARRSIGTEYPGEGGSIAIRAGQVGPTRHVYRAPTPCKGPHQWGADTPHGVAVTWLRWEAGRSSKLASFLARRNCPITTAFPGAEPWRGLGGLVPVCGDRASTCSF